MAVTATPVFPQAPKIGNAVVGGTANTNGLGTGTVGTDIMKVFTAGSNGSFVEGVQFHPAASAAATATTATTIRLYLSSVGSGSTTGGTDTFLIGEISAASQTADHSTNATSPLWIPVNRSIPSGYFLHATAHVVNAANTAWHATAYGRDY